MSNKKYGDPRLENWFFYRHFVFGNIFGHTELPDGAFFNDGVIFLNPLSHEVECWSGYYSLGELGDIDKHDLSELDKLTKTQKKKKKAKKG